MTELTEIVSGLGFVEGPVWTGRHLLVNSITQGVVYELSDNGGTPRTVATPGGGPNGLARTSDGVLWAAQGGGGHFDMECISTQTPGLLRIDATGTVDYALDTGVYAPSDCAIGPDGRVWFTDPQATFDIPVPGQIIAYDPNSGTATKLTSDADYPDGFYPNGIAFGLDPHTLYVADTKNRRVLRYAVSDDGLSAPQLFCEFRGFPDGLAVDIEGNVYVALLTKDVVAVHSADGGLVHRIELPGSGPTNVCFAHKGLQTMVVTASRGGRVLAGSAPVAGLPLHAP